MLIEAIRLIVTLATTAVGFMAGRVVPDWFRDSEVDTDAAIIVGALIGAGVGYVLGGLLGRTVRKGLERAPDLVARATGPQLFAGTFGMLAGLLVGVVIGFPVVLLLPDVVGWPIAALVILVLAAFGARVFATRAPDLLAVAGLRPRHPETAAEQTTGGLVLDSSAAIDGRILELCRAGLVSGDLRVPEFVLDELQGIADSGSKSHRRRGRRGLDVLEAVRDTPAVRLQISPDGFPGYAGVDAKLIALCQRSGATLVSTDHNLVKAAGLRGIPVLNPHALGESLRPALISGDRLSLTIEREGTEPGQGVGFLEDGTMVVIEDGGGLVGQTVDVEVANALRTNIGRMLFARLES